MEADGEQLVVKKKYLESMMIDDDQVVANQYQVPNSEAYELYNNNKAQKESLFSSFANNRQLLVAPQKDYNRDTLSSGGHGKPRPNYKNRNTSSEKSLQQQIPQQKALTRQVGASQLPGPGSDPFNENPYKNNSSMQEEYMMNSKRITS